MEVLGVVRLLAEAGVVIGQKTRQQLVSGGDRADTLKAKLLDQAILQGLVGALAVAGKSTCSKPRWQRKAKRGMIIPIKRITKAIFATLGYDIVRSSYSDDFDAFKQQRRL